MLCHVDISENELFERCPDVLNALLCDRTTGGNIFWATDSYAHLGEGYRFADAITAERITGVNGMVIQPRALKRREEQAERTKGMAEVFTPPWVCNAQNNLVDEAWFGRRDVFNTADETRHTWTATPGKIPFMEERTWKAYVRSTRMEITCGEAPYLASRYDTTTGESIALEERVGILDRKLRVVGENTQTTGEWLKWAGEAYKHTYGYEWQGDSLLLAREALLVTFVEYYQAKFGELPLERSLLAVADVISWNLWQMDGLKGVVPCSCKNGVTVVEHDLFGQKQRVEYCQGCRDGGLKGHNGIYCLIRDWSVKPAKETRFIDLIK
ncbi:MAG: restriction endonuclease subunit M [Prevotellaceae bacterium]|nr:restriction endonuclease subunit M [Prevotellaceae bacterium]